MSDERLPSIGQIREQYARGSFSSYGGSAEDGAYRRVSAQNTFDRWLAAHDAEVARQQAEHDAQIAEPAKEDLRMDAYYYGFTRTGVGIVDRILSAVACAGKAFHATERWIDYPYGDAGKTPEEWIQDAANNAAAAIRAQFPEETRR